MLNTRQTRFIEFILEGKSGKDACKLAGYKCKEARKYAYILLRKQDIKRHKEIREREIKERNEVTKDKLINDLNILHNNTTNDNVKAKCIELKAKITGNLSGDNVNVKITTINPNITEAQLIQALKDELDKRVK